VICHGARWSHLLSHIFSWDSLGSVLYACSSLYTTHCRRLARWVNAPTTGLELIRENIIRHHNVRSYCLDNTHR